MWLHCQEKSKGLCFLIPQNWCYQSKVLLTEETSDIYNPLQAVNVFNILMNQFFENAFNKNYSWKMSC